MEVSVGILHISFFVLWIESKCKFVLTCCASVILFSGLHIAFENIHCRILLVGLTCFLDVLAKFLCICHRVGFIVCTCYGCIHGCIFLVDLLCHLKLVLGCICVACLQVECSQGNVVKCIVCIGCHTLVVILLCAGCVALGCFDMAKIAICFRLNCCWVVEVLVEQFLGVVDFTYFEILDTVLVTLCIAHQGAT